MGRLEKTPAQPNECIVKGEKQIESLDETLNRLEGNLEKHNISLKEVQKKLAGKDNKLVYQAKDKAASADAVVEITKAYIKRLENAAIDRHILNCRKVIQKLWVYLDFAQIFLKLFR